jgi:hypothetical protein
MYENRIQNTKANVVTHSFRARGEGTVENYSHMGTAWNDDRRIIDGRGDCTIAMRGPKCSADRGARGRWCGEQASEETQERQHVPLQGSGYQEYDS